ncbi:uncharacterized protein LOC100186787 [Ciona intestinalis]
MVKISPVFLMVVAALHINIVCCNPTSRFECWFCKNEHSDEDCTEYGMPTTCSWKQVCYTESRVENGMYLITRGCKEVDACEALHMQNRTQCHPEINPSVCRTCCEKDGCNYHLDAGEGVLNTSIVSPTQAAGVGNDQFLGGRILPGGVPPPVPTEIGPPNCSHYVKPGPTPPNLLPEEQCRINVPPMCVSSGSIVFVLPKLPAPLREEGLKYSRARQAERGLCPRNPRLETKAVYEEDDSFVLLTIVNFRYSNALPVAQQFDHLVGGENVREFVKKARSGEP